MDVEAVRLRVVTAAGVALVVAVVAAFLWFAAWGAAEESLSGEPNQLVVGAAVLLASVAGMMGTAAAVGWVLTARD